MSIEQKNILLTCGRAPVTLDLARLFAQAGHRVVIAESMTPHLCQGSRAVAKSVTVPAPNQDPEEYIQALIDVIQSEKIDLLIPTCEEVFFVSKGRDLLRQHCHVFVDILDKLHIFHNKMTFIQRISDMGLDVPYTEQVESEEELKQSLSSWSRPFPVVLKPVYSRFGSQIHVIQEASQQLPSHIPISPESPWVVQEYLTGRPICTYGVAQEGKLLAHVAYSPLFTAGIGSGIHFEPVIHPEVERWVRHVVAAERFTGQISFDFIENEDEKLLPLECNPRATSGIHLFTSVDRLEEAFFHPVEQTIEPPPQRRRMLTLAMLLYGLPSIRSWQRLGKWVRVITSARDVLFRLRDPLPFCYQFAVLLAFWRISRQHQISITQASTLDIEWNGQP